MNFNIILLNIKKSLNYLIILFPLTFIIGNAAINLNHGPAHMLKNSKDFDLWAIPFLEKILTQRLLPSLEVAEKLH